MLSEDISVYLAHNYLNKHRKIEEEYTLKIISDTPVDQEKVKERIMAGSAPLAVPDDISRGSGRFRWRSDPVYAG